MNVLRTVGRPFRAGHWDGSSRGRGVPRNYPGAGSGVGSGFVSRLSDTFCPEDPSSEFITSARRAHTFWGRLLWGLKAKLHLFFLQLFSLGEKLHRFRPKEPSGRRFGSWIPVSFVWGVGCGVWVVKTNRPRLGIKRGPGGYGIQRSGYDGQVSQPRASPFSLIERGERNPKSREDD